jgi:broad specificity phosphatase PhoE
VDESLRRDFEWQPSSALYEWEMGDVSGRHLTKISAAEAERLIERFREKWGEQG